MKRIPVWSSEKDICVLTCVALSLAKGRMSASKTIGLIVLEIHYQMLFPIGHMEPATASGQSTDFAFKIPHVSKPPCISVMCDELLCIL